MNKINKIPSRNVKSKKNANIFFCKNAQNHIKARIILKNIYFSGTRIIKEFYLYIAVNIFFILMLILL